LAATVVVAVLVLGRGLLRGGVFILLFLVEGLGLGLFMLLDGFLYGRDELHGDEQVAATGAECSREGDRGVHFRQVDGDIGIFAGRLRRS
jgi:hypothetical protein